MANPHMFGWVDDPEAVSAVLADPAVAVSAMTPEDERALGVAATESRMETNRAPIILFDALLPLEPKWKRGRQGIGDCVSWGFELGATLVVAVDIMLNRAPWRWRGEYATEPIYGGSRVEVGNRRLGRGDGSVGAWAAQWLTKWGAVLRLDYSLATGNPEHDLRKYSAQKAKDWGWNGCGGGADGGKLDAVAKETPVREAKQTTTFAQAAAAIESGYPVPVCSGQGLSQRGTGGWARPQGSWSHCMLFAGARYDKPGLLVTNSWGNSWGTSAPFYPADYPHLSVLQCSAWVDAATCERMLRGGDSFALTGIDGLVRREIDWSRGWDIKGR